MLSQKAKYGLKALIALAEQDGEQLLQAAEMAARDSIPKKFLDLILLELRRHNFVQSVRGKNGGYLLAQPADRIRIGDIIRAIDGPLAPLPCASVTAYRRCSDCVDEKTCKVRRIMREVRDAEAAILDNISLADIAGTKQRGTARAAAKKRALQKII